MPLRRSEVVSERLAEVVSDTRSQIGDALAGKLTPEQLTSLIDEVLAIKKTGRGWCKHCNGAVMVEVSDPKAVTSALVDLANQAWGRPQDDKEDSGVVVNYRVELVGLEREGWDAPDAA